MAKWTELVDGDTELARVLAEYYALCVSAIPAFPGHMMSADDGFGSGEPGITVEGVQRLRDIYTNHIDQVNLFILAEQEAMQHQGYGHILETNHDARSASIVYLLANI